MRNSIQIVLLFALLAVSCSKEEMVQPCASEVHEESGSSKGLPTVVGTANGTNDQQGLGDPSGPKPPDWGGTGISDDGDDLSDSEKSRKKRR